MCIILMKVMKHSTLARIHNLKEKKEKKNSAASGLLVPIYKNR